MSLINCPECGKEISDTIKACPNCGFKIKHKKSFKMIGKKKIKAIIIIIGIIIILAAVAIFSTILISNQIKKAEAQRIADAEAQRIADEKKAKENDKINPDITGVIDSITIKTNVDFEPSLNGIKATDNLEGDLTSKIQITSNVNTNEAGEYTVGYSVQDSAGNSDYKTMTVIVENEYKKYEEQAYNAISKLYSMLKNPDSLQVQSINVQIRENITELKFYLSSIKLDEPQTWYSYAIDYSAQNGFGGMNREYFYISINEDGQYYKMELEPSEQHNTFDFYDFPIISIDVDRAFEAGK